MTAFLTFNTKDLVGYRMRIAEPIRPFAMNYLAASGIFDRISIETSDGPAMILEGADLIRASDVVGVLKSNRTFDGEGK